MRSLGSARIQRQNLARRAQRQFGPVGHGQFSEYTIKIFLYRALGKAQFVGDLLVGFRLADQRHDLLLAEGEFGVPGRLRDSHGGSAASRATILSSVGAKAISTTGATSCWSRWRDCNVVFHHEWSFAGSSSALHRKTAQHFPLALARPEMWLNTSEATVGLRVIPDR
jgi:hypothetical protein